MRREYLYFILALFLGIGLWMAPIKERDLNRSVGRAVEIYEEAQKTESPYRLSEAKALFLQSVADFPFLSVPRLNLGLGFFAEGDYKSSETEARAAQKFAAQENDREAEFLAYFNAARAAGEDQHIDQALDYYQKALTVHPESKEVKVNIELLWQGKGGGGGQDPKDQSGQEGQDPSAGEAPPEPPKYKGQELSQDDVRKILEELKNQEQKVRAEEYDKSLKEQPREKDW